MVDKFDKKKRSYIMSRIKDKNTKPEIILRKSLSKEGLRGYRLHYKLPGKPDIVFFQKKLVVFIDGDFWHGYNWKRLGKIPPKKYWQDKIEGTIKRDRKYNRLLRKEGWTVLRFWEHDIKKRLKDCINKIKKV